MHLYEPWGGLAEVRHYPTAADADAGTNLARTVSYGYDESGNLTETGDTDYSTSSPTLESTVYDELDRPSEVTVHYVPGGDRTLETAYDGFGNRKSLVFTDGSDVLTHSWTYDKLDRLAEADLASPNPLEFAYYANDDLETVIHGNGVTTEFTYFPEGPIESITAASPSEQLLELTYTVDKVLSIAGITEQHDAAGTNHAYSYLYDGLDRLTSASYPTMLGLPASEAFGYDAAGNREDPGSPSAYDYDANSRITASPGKTWVYDGDGNPVSVNAGLGSEETFSHDFSNRMRGYANAASSTTASYLYDPLARRIRKTVNGTSTWFVWDGDQLLAEFDGSGDRDRRYTYAGGFAPVEQAVVTGPSSEDVQQVHADHLDTPRGLSGAMGDAVWRAAYHAFGSTTPDEDPDEDLSDTRFAIRFPGQFADLESSLHDNRFRTYSSSLGRYLEEDPLRMPTDLNPHAYGRNGPIKRIDPFGLTTERDSRPRFGYASPFPDEYGRYGWTGDLPFMQPVAGACAILVYSRTNLPASLLDKLQHCWISCEIASRCGANVAAGLGSLKEIIDGPVRGRDASIEDLFADYDGIQCGRATWDPSCPRDCEACCRAKWGTP